MRRIGIPIVLALATLGLAGTSRPADARMRLTVTADCSPNGVTAYGPAFTCTAFTGGLPANTASYTYTWDVTVGGSSYHEYTRSFREYCTIGQTITGTVTVQDGTGATATASSTTYCASSAS
ncbi:MAG: hypothetical protein JO040_15680 [Gemmatimonadetes bacterium]|nr:hypothetical protein [Gemmatimonadota bacterium]